MPRIKPKLQTHIFSNFEFKNKLWPYGSEHPVKGPEARGWIQYRDRNFKVLQKFAPVAQKEVVERSLRVEREVQPHKVWKNLQFQLKADYLRMAKMVLVFHNYGLNATELRSLRHVAKNARCEWIQDKSLGELYATHLGDDKLRPLLVDGDAIFWVAYNTDEFKYITQKIVPFNYSFKLVAGLIVNTDFHSFSFPILLRKEDRLLMPSELTAFSELPTTKSYIGDNLLGPMMAQPYSLVSTLMGSVAQLANVLQFHLYKMKQAEKEGKKPEEKGAKAEGKAEEKGEKKEAKPEAKTEKKEGKPEAKTEKKDEKGEKKEAKSDAKAEKPKGEKPEKPKDGEQKK